MQNVILQHIEYPSFIIPAMEEKIKFCPSLSAEINLQDIDFQSCRFFLCPKKCTKNAPNLAPTHSYGRFQIQHIPQFPSSHALYNKVISVSKIPLVHFFRLSCKKMHEKGDYLGVINAIVIYNHLFRPV